MLYYSFPATVVEKYKGGVLVANTKGTLFYLNCFLRPGTTIFCTLFRKNKNHEKYTYDTVILDSVEYNVA